MKLSTTPEVEEKMNARDNKELADLLKAPSCATCGGGPVVNGTSYCANCL